MSRNHPDGDETHQDAGRDGATRRRWMGRWKLALIGLALVVAAASPWWGPLLMRRMDFFRVRRIEVAGVRYIVPSDIVTLLHVDTLASVWDPTAPLAARVARHPQVQRVAIHRKLPGTLVIDITENLPIALVPTQEGLLAAYDARGVMLPIDPARMTIDVPVLAERDTGLLRLLGAVRSMLPALYKRTSEVRRVGPEELLFTLDDVPVRTMANVTVAQLQEIEPVERDLAGRAVRVTELDLRFRDQVIARLQ
jgi:cell division septal protein FtsQ